MQPLQRLAYIVLLFREGSALCAENKVAHRKAYRGAASGIIGQGYGAPSAIKRV